MTRDYEQELHLATVELYRSVNAVTKIISEARAELAREKETRA